MRIESVISADAFVIYEAPSPPNRGVLDPITVILRDFGGSGQIIVECFGDAWATWFGAIGQQTLRSFLAGVSASYLADRLTASTCRRTAKREEAYAERIAGAVITALLTEAAAKPAEPTQGDASHD